VAIDADVHPHELRAAVPDRLPATVVRELSRLEPRRALTALAVEWVAIVAAIALTQRVSWLYPFAVVFIGARQAALTVIAHDAAHYRFLPSRWWNDAVGDLFADWPTFITLGSFRRHHGAHHQHLGEREDGNRFIWRTHTRDGALRAEWTYPKSPAAFVWKIARHSAVLTGLWWMIRGNLAAVVFRTSSWELAGRIVYTIAVAALLTATGTWKAFLLYWIVPFCTWHMTAQYIRLVCEHSGIPSRDPSVSPAYAQIRTTLARPWESFLLVPRNIHYHVEHHFYPSVPFYNLPALHEALMQQPGFRANAVVTGSVVASLRQVLTPAKTR
jgi:fatty acid desaturase